MKLYKLNYRNEIVELNVLKETDKTYVYTYPNKITGNTIRKKEVDVCTGKPYYHQIATTKAKLLQIAMEIIDDDITSAKKHVESLTELKTEVSQLVIV